MPHISNTESHKKKLLPWHHERWRWKTWDMSQELQAQKKGQGRECFICTEMDLSEKQKRTVGTQGVKPTKPSASIACLGKKQNCLPSIMTTNFEQTEITFSTISPLCRQVCSSWGGGLQVCRHRRRHSWVMEPPQPRMSLCRSPRCCPWGQKDPPRWALYP